MQMTSKFYFFLDDLFLHPISDHATASSPELCLCLAVALVFNFLKHADAFQPHLFVLTRAENTMWRRTYLFLVLVRLGFALSPSYLPLDSWATYTHLWSAFVRSERQPFAISATSASVEPHDLSASLKVLRAASKSFNAASLLLPWDLRTDLGCLYAFCRVADDLVDDEAEGLEAKTQNLEVIRSIVDAIYSEAAEAAKNEAQMQLSLTPISDRIRILLASLALSDKIKADIRAAAASIAPLTRYIPKRLWYEMLDGYGTDLRFEHPDADQRTREVPAHTS